MPKTISHDRHATWNIKGDNKTWVLEQQATIDVDNVSAIMVDAGNTSNRIKVLGDIDANGDAGEGVTIDGIDTRVVVGAKSVIDAYHGIDANVAGFRVINNGEIDGVSYGVTTWHMGTIRNNGEIGAEYAVLASDGAKIFNNKGAEIIGTDTGVFIGDGADSVVVNRGSISGVTNAIYLSGGADNRLINTGKIDGNIRFEGGNDVFDSSKGKFDGVIYGGDGNDTYKIGKQDIAISESGDGGQDRIYTAMSYSLGGTFETLHLTGKADINGSGNYQDNFVTGNAGDNTMSGGTGNDHVHGGGGDDLLIGGGDEDVFMFGRNDDTDRIDDFTEGEDVIWMMDFKGVDSFDDLEDRMSQHGFDTWIRMGNGDKLIVENVDKDDLGADDVIFAGSLG
jgi:Ca2+-binding RTX toxin-like protein